MFVLVWFLISFAFGIVAEFIEPVAFLQFLLSLAIILPTIALTARRLHDSGKSGWWQLIVLIPLVGIIIHIIFMVLPSDEGENRFGPHPAMGKTDVFASAAPAGAEHAPIPAAPAPASDAPESTDTPQQNQQG